ncbi:AMP-binding protein [Alcaligenaceae bacterium LF4-65]|jgi:long-chain acyl-CoA synthetase|uniref:Long-chain-fatty-acid--CoA ligase n=1 Tax=Zwartia hollandica TaxID=324606 RepID=A0A953T2R5_9BURK|nr:AMP-binding protein [Zwartia hollandica]MBZ1351768.1 AMP-binding protein [Zwartia hollandica]
MKSAWINSYPEGVPATISTDGYVSLVDLLEQACERYGPRTAVQSFGVPLTYAKLDEEATSFAKWLQSLKLESGARVALMMPNVLAYPVALLGTLKAGCVVVNVNPLCTPRELGVQLRDSGASVIVVFESVADTLEQVTDCEGLLHRVVVSPGDMLGPFKSSVINFGARHIKKLGPKKPMVGAWPWRFVLRLGRDLSWQAPDLSMDDLAALQYTGGTTGSPRAAMLTHRNLVTNVLQVQAVAQPALGDLLPRPLTMLTALPLYHVFAMTVCGLYALHAGMKSVLVINPRDRASLLYAWRKDPPHVLPGVNTLFNALLNEAQFAKLDFRHLRLAFGGGMAIHQAVAERWVAVTGRPLIEGYGLSETSPVVSANPTNASAYSGSIGLPLPSTEICIVDEQGVPVATGERGEIAVRGPQVMRGYWNAQEETDAARTPDGFFLTGDIGYIDAQGYVFLVDRKKDLIVVSGFNVYPSEVEAVVSSHPGVLECAAVGVPDSSTGEAVKLFVVPSDPLLSEDAVEEWCARDLSRYKCPRTIEFRTELPKSNVGKILRRALRS